MSGYSGYQHESPEEAALFDARIEQRRHERRMDQHRDELIAEIERRRGLGLCVRGCDDEATAGGLCFRCEMERHGEVA